MPGLNFIYDSKAGITNKKDLIRQASDSIIHFAHYRKKVLLDDNYYFLGCTTYDGYPVTSFENDEFLIYLEGRLYGLDNFELERTLGELANIVMRAENTLRDSIGKWLLNTDGDFVVFLLDKKRNRIAIVNDALGRLPLYLAMKNGKIIVSREIRFIREMSDNAGFDEMAIAQYLLFGYPLGKRTLFGDIDRVEPATLIKIDLEKAVIETETLHRFNLEQMQHPCGTISENADHLAELFNEACRKRTISQGGYKNVLSLSGGLDSRSVAASLRRNGIQFYGATFLTHNRDNQDDVEIARKIANVFNIEWQQFDLAPPKGKDFLRLFRIKSGLNYFGMSFILSFFERVKETYGSKVVYLTGDGGDKLLPDLRPSKRAKNADALIDDIVASNQIFGVNDVERLTGIARKEMIGELRNHLMSYPEESWVKKYVHFIIFERGFKWLFEGEDRNRCYFWSVAPFWAIPFFSYAMNCPDEQKEDYRLYRHFLKRLAPEEAHIGAKEGQISMAVKKFLMVNIYATLPQGIKKAIRKHLGKNASVYGNDSPMMKCFREQLDTSAVSHYLRLDTSGISNYNKFQINNLFSITSLIREREVGEGVFDGYGDTELI